MLHVVLGRNTQRYVGLSAMTLTAVMWGTSGTISRFLPRGASPLSTAWVRLAVAALVLNLVVARRRGYFRTLTSRYAICAGAALAINQMCFFGAIDSLGVAVTTMLVNGSSIILAGLAGAACGERPSRLWWCAAAFGVAGCVLTATGDGFSLNVTGLALGTLAGACYVGFGTALKRLGERSPDGLNNNAATMLYASLLIVPFTVGRLGWLASPGAVVPALALGAFCTAIPFCFFSVALKRISVGQALAIGLLEPFTAGVLGLALLGERLSGPAALGMAAQVVCLLLSTVDTIRGQEKPAENDVPRECGEPSLYKA